MRLIDADDLHVDYLVPSTTTMTECYRYVSKVQIDNAHTIEAVPVRHGRWNRVGDTDWECTACGGFSCCAGAYCPDCGARMEGADDDMV